MRQIVKSSLGKAKYILFCGVMTTFWRRDGTIINFFFNSYVFYITNIDIYIYFYITNILNLRSKCTK